MDGCLDGWVDGWLITMASLPASFSKLFMSGFLSPALSTWTDTWPCHLGSLVPFICLNNHLNLWSLRLALLSHGCQLGFPPRLTQVWFSSYNFAKNTLPSLVDGARMQPSAHSSSEGTDRFGAPDFLLLPLRDL